MQRLHAQDLTGYLQQKTGANWECISLPAIAPERMVYQIKDYFVTQEAGQALHAQRESNQHIEVVKQELGSYAFAAQYLQTPVIKDGAMLKLDWLQRYTTQPKGRIIQSWDTAIKAQNDHDYSVCTIWSETISGYYLLEGTSNNSLNYKI